MTTPAAQPVTAPEAEWHPLSWRRRPVAMDVPYPDAGALQRAVERLGALPPLVTSGEIEQLRRLIAEAQEGKRFLLQGGDCAEALSDCTPGTIAAKLKILLQMSLVIVFAGKKPVIRVGRIAGQYAKPRSSMTETRAGRTLPSYFGDLINRAPFDLDGRTPDPSLLLTAYQHAGLTLNFVRSLIAAGFTDIHHPEYWNLTFLGKAGLTAETREQYERLTRRLRDSVDFMEAVGERNFESFSRVEFFTSHEGLSLWYESAQTRRVPRKAGWWNLTTHLPWIGERTRALDGAHVEYFRGIRNPLGVKLGPATAPDELLALIAALNPGDEPGRVVLIPRMGQAHVHRALPPLVKAVQGAGRRVLWVADPMHGNTRSTASGLKTRDFADVLAEMQAAFDILGAHGAHLGGVHVELTGEDVTECVGGSGGITEADLARNYASPCDPRLNYEQAMELAFALSRKLS
ncbi:MAG: 3-deoxy-7-phosphoheptulonate synthase [Phycisphaerales bacterium]|nr:3-deoxy-7-phosphoheptulonate synthase [Phycisphaerales bacterium]